MSKNNIFTSYKSDNLNSFQGQSENPSSKSSKTHSKSPLSIRNQENIGAHDFNLLNKNISYSKERAASEHLKNSPIKITNKNDEDAQIIKEEEEKKAISSKTPSLNAIDEIMEPLRRENDGAPQILYKEGDHEEEANVSKGKLLRDSILSQFEKGITEYVDEKGQISQEKQRKIIPKLNPKNYKLVEILGRGYHGAACKLRDKDHNEMVVKLYFKEQKEDFFNEACVLSEFRQSDARFLGEDLIFKNREKGGIPPCFEMEKYYGLTLQAGFATLRDLKKYLKQTDKRLNEAQLCDLIREMSVQYSGLTSLRYAHRDIKPENIIFLPSFRVKIIDFGFATKFNTLVEMKGGVGTSVYMNPDLLKKGSKDSLTFAEAVAGDWFALGLSILEIAEPNFDVREVNRAKAIKRALEKIKSRSKILYKRIQSLLNYEKLGHLPFEKPIDFHFEMLMLFEDDDNDLYCEPEFLREVLEEFKEYLEEKNFQKKEEVEMKKSLLKEDDEKIKALFEESQEYLEIKGGERDQVGLSFYSQIPDFLSPSKKDLMRMKEIVHALVDNVSREGCSYCKKLKETWEKAFAEGGEVFMERFHEKEIEEIKKEEIEGNFGLWGHLNNVMVLKEYIGLLNEGKIDLKDEISEYLRRVIQSAVEQASFSEIKVEILGNFPCYYLKNIMVDPDHIKDCQENKLYPEDDMEFYLNMFQNICNSKTLRVIKMLIRESNFKFLKKLQCFSVLYHEQMLNWKGAQFEKKLDIFVFLLRFVNLFCEEPGPFRLEGLNNLQVEARALSQQLKILFSTFKSRDYDNCIQKLLKYELFYVMIGSYMIYWSHENSSAFNQSELLKENILLLMPLTDTIRVAFTLYMGKTHPLENILDEKFQAFQTLQSLDPFIFRYAFELKLDQKTQEFTGSLCSLELSHFPQEFNHLIKINIGALSSLKEMYLLIENESSVSLRLQDGMPMPAKQEQTPIEEEPLELNLESLEVDISDSGLALSIFEIFVNFLAIQRSLKVLKVSFLANSTSDEHMKYLAESVRNLQELNLVKLNFVNCHFLGEDDLRMISEEFGKMKKLKSLNIFVGGCPKVTQTLELGEFVRMKVEPVILNPDVYVEQRKWD